MKSLGRIASKSDPRTLHMAQFLGAAGDLPERTNFWDARAGFSPDSWGNTEQGCCTFAKQANMFRRFERLEQRRTIDPPDKNVLAAYYNLTQRLYGGGDTGAYEEDALSASRRPETAICDSKGRPLLIDAYLRLNPSNQIELRRAIAMARGHGIAVCINLPLAFVKIDPPENWDIPDNQPMVDFWKPGSWGGHSMWAIEYGVFGILLEHTWNIPPQWISWRAAAAYLDEAHLVIDSVNSWKTKAPELRVGDVVDAVNAVSSTKIILR